MINEELLVVTNYFKLFKGFVIRMKESLVSQFYNIKDITVIRRN